MLSFVASLERFERSTRCLEGSRSIQLSYWDASFTHKFYDKSNGKTSCVVTVFGIVKNETASFLLHQLIQAGIFIQGPVQWGIKLPDCYLGG